VGNEAIYLTERMYGIVGLKKIIKLIHPA